MKTLLSTLAVATLIIATSSCTKAPMPVPDNAAASSRQSVYTGAHARFFDSTRFVLRDAAAPPPMSAY